MVRRLQCVLLLMLRGDIHRNAIRDRKTKREREEKGRERGEVKREVGRVYDGQRGGER